MLTTHVVPVFHGKLVLFEFEERSIAGRWLPWTTMEYGDNPYVTASAIVDEWCNGAMRDLRLVDVMSMQMDEGIWELAIMFRVELAALPAETSHRKPLLVEAAAASSVGRFETVDLERWVGILSGGSESPKEKLLF